MNTIGNKTTGASITTTTVIIGVVALAIGLVIGVTAAESGTGIFGAARTANTPTNQVSSSSTSSLKPDGQSGWNPFDEINNMQAQMDQMFNRMSEQFRMEPGFPESNEIPGYSLSLDVRDLKDHFEVKAFLPDTKLSDVKVNLQNNQTLKVDVSRQENETSSKQNATASVNEWGQYEQVVQLPGPVKAGGMKIERKDHELLITLPKATVS